MRRFFDEQAGEELEARYRAGWSLRDLGEYFGCSSPTCRNELVRRNARMRPRGKLPEMECGTVYVAQAHRMWLDGLSYAQIGILVCAPAQYVEDVLVVAYKRARLTEADRRKVSYD